MVHEPIEEIRHQFSLQIAHQTNFDQIPVHKRGTTPEIHRDHGQRLIHRKNKIAGTVNAFAVAKGFRKQLADYDADVFHRVVLIDIEIADSLELKIEPTMLGKKFQHVIEKPDSRRN